jgi:hypothetical protein
LNRTKVGAIVEGRVSTAEVRARLPFCPDETPQYEWPPGSPRLRCPGKAEATSPFLKCDGPATSDGGNFDALLFNLPGSIEGTFKFQYSQYRERSL